jgi:hypothetical protein
MNYFQNELALEQYYTNNCQQLISLNMDIDKITRFVTNPKTSPKDKGEFLEWQLFDWLNKNGFTPSKTTYFDQQGLIKGDGGIDLFATRMVNNQRMNFVIQSKCYVSQKSIINEEVIGKLIQRAEQYNAIGILFCYDLSHLTNGTQTTDNAIRLIKEHPRIMMFDINTIHTFVTQLTKLTPSYELIVKQHRIKEWVKIGTVTNVQQIGDIVIKADKIEGLEFKSFY